MNENDFAELAAGAALHSLSPDDERRFLAALAEHPEWRAITEDDTETAAMLSDQLAVETPPGSIRSSLLDLIAVMPQHSDDADATRGPEASDGARRGETAPSPTDSPLPDAPRRWTRLIFALAACIALVVGIGVGAVALNGVLNRPASVVALEQIENAADARSETVELDAGGTATAHWSASLGTAVLVADGIAALAEGETYELWFVRGETPIPAGVFAADGGAATAVLSGDMESGDVIAVTVEQAGGSPTGQPTTDPIIVIPTA